MARDKENKSWQYVGIRFDSAAWRGLVEDSQSSGIPIPTLIALRVEDWYKMARGGVTITPSATTASGATQKEEEPQPDNQAEKNADEAFDAWKDLM